MPDVRLPNGTVVRNVPEGTTRGELTRRLMRAKTESLPVVGGAMKAVNDLNELGAATNAGIVHAVTGIPDLVAGGERWLMGKAADLTGHMGFGDRIRAVPTLGEAYDNADPLETAQAARHPYVKATAEAVGSVMGGTLGGRALAKSAKPIAAKLGKWLAAHPGAQTIGAVAAANATELAKAAGAPLPVQLGAGLLLGAVAPGALDVATKTGVSAVRSVAEAGVPESAARIVKGAMIPLTQQRLAPDIAQAHFAQMAKRLGATESAVPGVEPTTAEASLDPGLAGLQRSLGDISVAGGASVSQRLGRNAVARAEAVDDAFGTGDPEHLKQLALSRDAEHVAAVDTAKSRIAPLEAPALSGRDIREGMPGNLAEGAAAARAKTRAAYDELGDGEHFQWGGYDPADALPSPGVGPSRTIDPQALEGLRTEAVKASMGRLPKKPQSLTQFIIARGGLRPRATDAESGGTMVRSATGKGRYTAWKNPTADGIGDLYSSGITPKSHPKLFRQDGMTGDQAYQAAREAGYFRSADAGMPDEGDARELMEALANEHGGAPRMAEEDIHDWHAYHDAERNRDHWRGIFADRDLDPVKMTEGQWRQLYADLDPATARAAEGRPATLTEVDATNPARGRVLGRYQGPLLDLRDRFFGPNGEDAPREVRDFMARVLEPDTVTPGRLERWARNAHDIANGHGPGAIGGYMRAFGRALSVAAERERPEYQRPMLAAAKQSKIDEATTFGEGPVGKALGTEYGRYSMDDAMVPGALVPRGRAGVEAAEQLTRAAGPEAAERVARGELRRQIGDGETASAFDATRRAYGDTLAAHPALGSDVDAARETAALSDAFRRTEFGRLARPDADPAAAVGRLMAAKDGGRSFHTLATEAERTPAALAGLRRSLAAHLKESSRGGQMIEQTDLPSDVPDVTKLRRGLDTLLDRTQPTRALDIRQRRVLKTISSELKAQDFAARANKTAGSSTIRNAETGGKLIQQAVEHVASMAVGGGGTVLGTMFKVLDRTGDVRDLATQAMLNPKLAAELLMTPTPERVREAAKRSLFLGTGAVVAEPGALEGR